MAYIERYVTSTAGGGGDGSSGSPWTLAEAFANAVAGDRVNIQSDGSYSITGGTVSNTGSLNNPIVFSGYNVVIGDLDGQGRNSDSSLDTTNFPDISTTSTVNMASGVVFQNLNISGNVSGAIIGNVTVDDSVILSCRIVNGQSSTAAQAVYLDNGVTIIESDLVCSGGTHGVVVQVDTNPKVIGCRLVGTSTTATIFTGQGGFVEDNTFIGGSSSVGVVIENFIYPTLIKNNTFYNLGTAIQTPNSTQIAYLIIINNHITDCGIAIYNSYQATDTHSLIELNSRTRDNTVSRSGFDNSLNISEVTTDTGGPETDYVDAPNGDVTLIATAPAVDAGLGM